MCLLVIKESGLFSHVLGITLCLLFLLYLLTFESWFCVHRSLVGYNKKHLLISHGFLGSGSRDGLSWVVLFGVSDAVAVRRGLELE